MTSAPSTTGARQASRTAARPSLVFFYSSRSGASRRVEGFLAQVLQRRRNHDTFRIYRVDDVERPDLVKQLVEKHGDLLQLFAGQ